MNSKVLCCIGQSSLEFPWDYNKIECNRHQEYLEAMACYIDLYIRKYNISHFICGGNNGANADFARLIIDLRNNIYDNIMLEIVIPNDHKYTKNYIVDQNIITNTNKITKIDSNIIDCNKYLINKSDIVFMFINKKIANNSLNKILEYVSIIGKKIVTFDLSNY